MLQYTHLHSLIPKLQALGPFHSALLSALSDAEHRMPLHDVSIDVPKLVTQWYTSAAHLNSIRQTVQKLVEPVLTQWSNDMRTTTVNVEQRLDALARAKELLLAVTALENIERSLRIHTMQLATDGGNGGSGEDDPSTTTGVYTPTPTAATATTASDTAAAPPHATEFDRGRISQSVDPKSKSKSKSPAFADDEKRPDTTPPPPPPPQTISSAAAAAAATAPAISPTSDFDTADTGGSGSGGDGGDGGDGGADLHATELEDTQPNTFADATGGAVSPPTHNAWSDQQLT